MTTDGFRAAKRRGQRSPKAIRWAALLYEAAIVNANSVVDQGRRCRLARWHESGAHAPRPTQHATGLALRSPWRQLCFKRQCIPPACGPANAPRKVTDSPSNSHKRKPYFGDRQSCWPGKCNTTFELSGRRRQDARPGLVKIYRVPPDRAWRPAVGAPLERGVRPHSRQK